MDSIIFNRVEEKGSEIVKVKKEGCQESSCSHANILWLMVGPRCKFMMYTLQDFALFFFGLLGWSNII